MSEEVKVKEQRNDLESTKDRADALLTLILACLVIGFVAVITLMIVLN